LIKLIIVLSSIAIAPMRSALAYIDGLVYNYGNSVCENFSGDAKNVLNFPKRAH